MDDRVRLEEPDEFEVSYGYAGKLVVKTAAKPHVILGMAKENGEIVEVSLLLNRELLQLIRDVVGSYRFPPAPPTSETSG